MKTAKYAINKEGEQSLRDLAHTLQDGQDYLIFATERLEAIISGLGSDLGNYEQDILDTISEIRQVAGNCSGEIQELARRLNMVADRIGALLNRRLGSSEASSGTEDLAPRSDYSARPAEPFSGSETYRNVVKELSRKNIEYIPLTAEDHDKSEAERIDSVGGCDRTEGSCSSLAFAYIGCLGGYDIRDFRGSKSRDYFSRNENIAKITKLPGVISETVYDKDDYRAVDALFDKMEDGKEYYLATGAHASVVRRSNGKLEYLELQSEKRKGWHRIDTNEELEKRFGCSHHLLFQFPNYLIDADSLKACSEFLDILGYINTAVQKQQRGGGGHAR